MISSSSKWSSGENLNFKRDGSFSTSFNDPLLSCRSNLSIELKLKLASNLPVITRVVWFLLISNWGVVQETMRKTAWLERENFESRRQPSSSFDNNHQSRQQQRRQSRRRNGTTQKLLQNRQTTSSSRTMVSGERRDRKGDLTNPTNQERMIMGFEGCC